MHLASGQTSESVCRLLLASNPFFRSSTCLESPLNCSETMLRTFNTWPFCGDDEGLTALKGVRAVSRDRRALTDGDVDLTRLFGEHSCVRRTGEGVLAVSENVVQGTQGFNSVTSREPGFDCAGWTESGGRPAVIHVDGDADTFWLFDDSSWVCPRTWAEEKVASGSEFEETLEVTFNAYKEVVLRSA